MKTAQASAIVGFLPKTSAALPATSPPNAATMFKLPTTMPVCTLLRPSWVVQRYISTLCCYHRRLLRLLIYGVVIAARCMEAQLSTAVCTAHTQKLALCNSITADSSSSSSCISSHCSSNCQHCVLTLAPLMTPTS
eukprot:21057-Heterococcus_DN1.PRE.5